LFTTSSQASLHDSINRLQSRDLVNLTKSKSTPDALRQAANRLVAKRRETGG
jgi:hypothetical protein